MKKIYTIFLLVAISTNMGIAQNSKTKKAHKLYIAASHIVCLLFWFYYFVRYPCWCLSLLLKIYTIFLLVAISTNMGIAQNSKTKKADKLYERLQYTDAAEAYAKLLKKGENDHYVYERLGNSYYFINDTKQAETYYKRVVDRKNVSSERSEERRVGKV